MVACGMAENIVLTNKYKNMNREIKFRAWQDDQMLQQPMSGNYALARFIGFLYEDAPIMQFTGLLINIKSDGFNKNGDYKTKKNLFESDIIEFKSSAQFTLGYEVIGEKYVVVYQAELAGGFF